MRQITYKIQRFDGEKSFTQEYRFPHQPGKTILWGLIHIREQLDPTLAFVASCRSAICGACAVSVNRQAVLTCETSLDDTLARYHTDSLLLEPLGNFPVIRDLVVDWDAKVAGLATVNPWLMPTAATASQGCLQSVQEFKKIKVQTACILCGACASACAKLSANSDDFLEPFIYSKAQRFVADSRDQSPAAHLEPALQQGLWKCMHCQQCVSKCPKKLDPARDISRLRQESIRRGGDNHPGARHALVFYEHLANLGRLNEMKLGIKTEGFLKTLRRLPLALRLIRRGKLNPLHRPTPVKGLNEIQTIMQAVKEARQS